MVSITREASKPVDVWSQGFGGGGGGGGVGEAVRQRLFSGLSGGATYDHL
jgi:hypothetical protein